MSTTPAPVAAHTPDTERLSLEAVITLGRLCKTVDAMRQFWRNGTPIYAGSLLAEQACEQLDRIMTGPLVVPELERQNADLLDALLDALDRMEASQPPEGGRTDQACIKARAVIQRATQAPERAQEGQ